MTPANINQLDKVKAALLKHDPVNPVTMFNEGITRLSAIIKRLRDRGYPIITRRDNGNGLAYYSLPEGWQVKPPNQASQDKKRLCKLPNLHSLSFLTTLSQAMKIITPLTAKPRGFMIVPQGKRIKNY